MYNELTEVDIRKMQEEIDYRMKVVRPKCIEDLKTARGFGDLSENYEYKAAKQELRRCDSRLRYLKRMIATAKVIEADAREGVAGLFDRVNRERHHQQGIAAGQGRDGPPGGRSRAGEGQRRQPVLHPHIGDPEGQGRRQFAHQRVLIGLAGDLRRR